MAIELLLFAPPHRAIHDAESLIYVLLFLCSHLDGPGTVHNPPLLGSGSGCKHPSGINQWLSANSLNMLGHAKFSHMTAHFEVEILLHVSTYFKPLVPHIRKLWDTLFEFKSMQMTKDASRSVATLRGFIDALKTVLLDKKLRALAEITPSGGSRKRSCPGDSVVRGNSWDAVPVKKKTATRGRRKSVLRRK